MPYAIERDTADRALIAEALRKAAVVWLWVGQRPGYPVWCEPVGDALFVVTGPGEQPAPGLTRASTVHVGARGDHGGLVATWTATVTRIRPNSDRWQAHARALAGKRLNATGSIDDVLARWAHECAVLALDLTDGEPQPE
ncbi:MAG TPA: hypothetical protein VH442_10990 [Micromonosporaceae bacterium]